MNNKIAIIGDVHGKYDSYYNIASKYHRSIQLGDFGFFREWMKLNTSDLDPLNHKIIGGNHDDYDYCVNSPFYTGNHGKLFDGFFIRGGVSIDRTYRVGERLTGGPKTWWSQEELNFKEMMLAREDYKKCKPEIMFSHAPPSCVKQYLFTKNDDLLTKFGFSSGYVENTMVLFDELLIIHKPKLWFFGHMHRSLDKVINGTRFVGLKELEVFEL